LIQKKNITDSLLSLNILVFSQQIIRLSNRSEAWSFLEKYVFKPDLMKDHTLTVFYQVFWLRPNVRANTRFHFCLLYLQKTPLLLKLSYIMILPEVYFFLLFFISCRLIFDDGVCLKKGLNCYSQKIVPAPASCCPMRKGRSGPFNEYARAGSIIIACCTNR